jgi:hypothetical protein
VTPFLPSSMVRLATIDKVIAAVIAGSVVIYFVGRKISKRKHLPPGPRPLPLIGNAYQVPRTHPWLTYSAWAKQYGIPTYQFVLRPAP